MMVSYLDDIKKHALMETTETERIFEVDFSHAHRNFEFD